MWNAHLPAPAGHLGIEQWASKPAVHATLERFARRRWCRDGYSKGPLALAMPASTWIAGSCVSLLLALGLARLTHAFVGRQPCLHANPNGTQRQCPLGSPPGERRWQQILVHPPEQGLEGHNKAVVD